MMKWHSLRPALSMPDERSTGSLLSPNRRWVSQSHSGFCQNFATSIRFLQNLSDLPHRHFWHYRRKRTNVALYNSIFSMCVFYFTECVSLWSVLSVYTQHLRCQIWGQVLKLLADHCCFTVDFHSVFILNSDMCLPNGNFLCQAVGGQNEKN